MTEHRHIEPQTPEQETTARLASLERDFGLLHALRKYGVRFRPVGGTAFYALNQQIIKLPPPDADPELSDRQRYARVRKNDMVLPDGRVLTPAAVIDPICKTAAKKAKFLRECTPTPELTRFIVVEAGEEYERRAIATAVTATLAQMLARQRVGVSRGEPFRAVEVLGADDETVEALVESKRDELPWNEKIGLREDLTFPVTWHGCRLDGYEREELRRQQSEDIRGKRERRDKVIRQMQREPITA